MKLLLLSNSTMKGEAYLSWPLPYLSTFLDSTKDLLFVPYAAVTMSYEQYAQAVSEALQPIGIKVKSIHCAKNKLEAIKNASCIAVGGGNTFQLLKMMQDQELLKPICQAVKSGTPYVGWSAGSNVACPTIMTTNDMPIAMPASFEALGLINFQINAHYTTQTIANHGGESRDTRIAELMTINADMQVIGLPEGKLLELNDNKWYLRGIKSEPTRLFRPKMAPSVLSEGQVEI